MDDGLYLKEGNIDTSEIGIKYWAEKLKCTEKNLNDAICRIGTKYNLLVLYLELNRQIDKT